MEKKCLTFPVVKELQIKIKCEIGIMKRNRDYSFSEAVHKETQTLHTLKKDLFTPIIMENNM